MKHTAVLLGMLLSVLAGCTRGPDGREVAERIADYAHPVGVWKGYGTAHLPRIAISADTRVVLTDTAGQERGETSVSATINIPAGALMDFSYGIAEPNPFEAAEEEPSAEVSPTGAVEITEATVSAEFRIVRTSSGDSEVIFEQSLTSKTSRWVNERLALSEGEATLRFETSFDAESGRPAYFSTPIVTRPATKQRPWNVVLVSLDTLRADHLGLYGYDRATSPRMDQIFSEEALVIDHAFTQATNTIGGHMAMLKGLLPKTVRVGQLDARVFHSGAALSIADVLRRHGYRTAAFTENAMLDGPAGFNFGFEHYYEIKNVEDQHDLGHIERTFDAGIDWLGDHKDEAFFLFLHTYQVHNPYAAPDRLAGLFPTPPDAHLSRVDMDEYDREIVYTDEIVGELVDRLREMGLLERTIFILTADHGEEFNDHGFRYHGPTLKNEVLRVPLVFRAPGLIPQAERRAGPASLTDILPTVLDLLDIAPPHALQGRSLVAHMLENTPLSPVTIYSEATAPVAFGYGPATKKEWIPPAFSAMQWPLRLLRLRTQEGFRYELYDLKADPGENEDVYASRANEAEALRRDVDAYERSCNELREILVRRAGKVAAPVAEAIDPAREEKLRVLGYIE